MCPYNATFLYKIPCRIATVNSKSIWPPRIFLLLPWLYWVYPIHIFLDCCQSSWGQGPFVCLSRAVGPALCALSTILPLRLESLMNFGCKIVLCKERDFSSTTALHELGLTTLTSEEDSIQSSVRFPAYLLRLHLTLLGSSPLLPNITILTLSPLANSTFFLSSLHLGRGHLVVPVLLSGVVYLRLSARHRIFFRTM